MTGADLWAELSSALAAMPAAQDQHLLALGVPIAQLQICGGARVTTDGDLYRPDAFGEPTVIVPIWLDGQGVDAVAFNSREPRQWWRRFGVADYLGGDALAHCWECGYHWPYELIDVFETPLDWLINGARPNSLCILTSNPRKLDFLGAEIVARSEAHADALSHSLTMPAFGPVVRYPLRVAA